MQEFLGENYIWLKAFHLIAVICWMAGLLYLPRLFVYHRQTEAGSDADNMLRTMELRLLKIIMNPAMILSWIFGLMMLVANPALFEAGWMHVKFSAVVVMSILHMVYAKWRKLLAEGKTSPSENTFRLWNEVPALLMIIIVIMALVEPF